MRLEDLLNVKVTSVSKREQSLARTAAAVFVITQEDIRRSGANSLPELLRMAPGVDVEQMDANAWAVSIRGFNARYSNKVLVLIDGRSVYSPAFSGVYWEHLDMPVENIDRIEVIRGPGASVWGANAVNGVISILTKSSKDTRGGLVTTGGGTQRLADGMAQFGGRMGPGATYRAFGEYFAMNNAAAYGATPANDRWNRAHGGFRTDWDVTPRDSLMVQGDLFANHQHQTVRSNSLPTPFDSIRGQSVDAAGGDLMARWNHTLAGGSQTSLQGYFDAYRRTEGAVPERLRTFDIDFQHHLNAGDRHDIVWGAGYRVYNSALAPGYDIAFTPPSRTNHLYSAFFQDELRVTDSLWLTAGVKLEHNPYTGFQTEPTVRAVWNRPSGRHTVWASASKSVRQPARTDTSVDTVIQTLPLGPDIVQAIRLLGNPKIKDEQSRDFELGYRATLSRNLSLDLSSFLTFYRHLETLEPQAAQVAPGPPLRITVPLVYDNLARAVTYGGELSMTWNATSRWRIIPGYSYLHATLRQDPASHGMTDVSIVNGFPQNMAQIRSQWNLTRKVQFDQSLYYTAGLPGSSQPGRAHFDLRIARPLGESAEVSVVGQNLLRPATPGYPDTYWLVGTQTARSIYAKIAWRF
jgi:iron complex outermembrane receptor protein